MSKNPKSVVISFRLKPAVIAKAIDGLKNYDKSSDITRLSSIIKQTTLHGINYLTQALPFEPTEESQILVHNLTTQGSKAESIEQSILGQPLRNMRFDSAKQSNETKFFDISDEKPSSSVKSVVLDFSMPKDLLDELDEGEKE